jgi:hypothetical protein
MGGAGPYSRKRDHAVWAKGTSALLLSGCRGTLAGFPVLCRLAGATLFGNSRRSLGAPLALSPAVRFQTEDELVPQLLWQHFATALQIGSVRMMVVLVMMVGESEGARTTWKMSDVPRAPCAPSP